MITYNQFCNTFAVSVGSAVFEEVKRRAERKRNYIISRFGDGYAVFRRDTTKH